MDSSCSFRITRTAEDLAQTITALSQRLVKLEQRQDSLELSFGQREEDVSAEEMKVLDGVDQLLKECQELLASSDTAKDYEDNQIDKTEDEDELLAA